jgi:hypothetical protein
MDTTVPKNVLHITIGAVPSGGQTNLSLENELRLLKAALLYADRVKYCSLQSSIVLAILSLGDADLLDLVKIYAQTTHDQTALQGLEMVKTLRRKKHRSGRETVVLQQIERLLKEVEKNAKEYLATLAADSGIGSLEVAHQSGLVEVEVFDGETTDAIMQKYFDSVSQAVISGETYPLFDDMTGDLIGSAISAGKLSVTDASRSRAAQIGLSSDLFERLPLFDKASIDEILDIRKELGKPLIRFRAAIIQFSADIMSVPWEADFPHDAERVFRQHVEPAVLDIEEACKSNKALLDLAPLMASAVLGVLISQVANVPDILIPALGLGGIQALSNTVRSYREKNSHIQGNHLYFYYGLRQRLSR